jgi:hypothetical protein
MYGVTVAQRHAAAMPTVMLDDPGSNPGVNHGCMYLSRRTNVFCLVLSNYVVYRQLGKKPVDVSVYSITWVSLPQIKHMRACWKGL